MNMLTPQFREVAARFTLPQAKQTPGFTKVEVAVHKRIHRIPSVTKILSILWSFHLHKTFQELLCYLKQDISILMSQ